MAFKRISIFILAFFTIFKTFAAEGMWLPFLLKQLNEKDMKTLGMRISADDIYSINHSSLKDAVFLFGGGCTSEIVSTQGLLFTNHHCGFGNIQSHSTLEHNYLKNGFVAKNFGEELANEGLSATRIVRMEDVTAKALAGITSTTSEKDRKAMIESNIAKIKDEALAGTKFDAIVKPFFYGNEYILIVSETFKDIRLVFAPPQSVGEFGGDTDNWMWPRHNGDFSVFRIYADKENKPAAYSKENVPYKPLKHLPVSLKGVKQGDFTFVYGFPGNTQQYLSSYAVDYVMNIQNPMRVRMRKVVLEVINTAMQSDEGLKIKYSAKEARISNAYKKWIGEGRGLRRLNALDVKRALESSYMQKAVSNPEYAKVLGDLKSNYPSILSFNKAHDLYIEYIFSGPEILRYARNFSNVVENYETLKAKGELDKAVSNLKIGTAGFFKNLDLATEKKIFKVLTPLFFNEIERSLAPKALIQAHIDYDTDFNLYADRLYEETAFASKEKMENFLNNLSPEACNKMKQDKGYLLAASVYDAYLNLVEPDYGNYADKIETSMRIYVQGLRTLLPTQRKYYPDANSTLRVSYGKVQGFEPNDGTVYNYYTTSNGIMQKYVANDPDFDLNERVRDLFTKKDFGQYAENGVLHVAFTASNHTTGGNSGSPVMNANGELIGLNFDRAWESTMSDIMYDPDRCRNIIVDIRYVLWVIDKWGGADHLIKEMELRK